ncbi:complex I NDUFA9 subunit family protein [Roseobacteraceae bacterium NS-SX3]
MGICDAIVLGGTGFLGRRAVRRLQEHGCTVSIGTRFPHAEASRGVRLVHLDLMDRDALAHALNGPDAVINCIGLYHETRRASFRDVHVDAARRVAETVRANAGQILVHISGIGASRESPSAYVRARAEGEAAVRQALPAAVILRPSVMFSRDGAFFGDLERAFGRLPVVPLFGDGGTRLQPVYAGDVAEAISRVIATPSALGRTFELGGPEVFTYREILMRLAARAGRRQLLMPVPFTLWRILAAVLAPLPKPPVTPAQIALIQCGNVVSGDAPGFAELAIEPRSATDMGLI